MDRRVINPWTWQNEMGFAQAFEVTNVTRTLICSGQTSVSPEGQPMHEGDMRAQINLALDNLQAVLDQAGYDVSNIVRLDFFTTDVDQFFAAFDILGERLNAAGCVVPGTLLGVSRLAFPELMVEIEAMAMK